MKQVIVAALISVVGSFAAGAQISEEENQLLLKQVAAAVLGSEPEHVFGYAMPGPNGYRFDLTVPLGAVRMRNGLCKRHSLGVSAVGLPKDLTYSFVKMSYSFGQPKNDDCTGDVHWLNIQPMPNFTHVSVAPFFALLDDWGRQIRESDCSKLVTVETCQNLKRQLHGGVIGEFSTIAVDVPSNSDSALVLKAMLPVGHCRLKITFNEKTSGKFEVLSDEFSCLNH
jgi:hypothetical protein